MLFTLLFGTKWSTAPSISNLHSKLVFEFPRLFSGIGLDAMIARGGKLSFKSLFSLLGIGWVTAVAVDGLVSFLIRIRRSAMTPATLCYVIARMKTLFEMV